MSKRGLPLWILSFFKKYAFFSDLSSTKCCPAAVNSHASVTNSSIACWGLGSAIKPNGLFFQHLLTFTPRNVPNYAC